MKAEKETAPRMSKKKHAPKPTRKNGNENKHENNNEK